MLKDKGWFICKFWKNVFFSGFYSHCSFSFIFLFFKNYSNFLILKLKDEKCFNFKINRLYN